jgi:hypothetical protein
LNKIQSFWLSDETTVQQVVLIDIGYPPAGANEIQQLFVYNFLRGVEFSVNDISQVPRFDISYPPMLPPTPAGQQHTLGFPIRLEDIYFGDGINLPNLANLGLSDPLWIDLYFIQRICAMHLP